MAKKKPTQEERILRLQDRMLHASDGLERYSNMNHSEALKVFNSIPEACRIGLKCEVRPARHTEQVGKCLKIKTEKTGCYFRMVEI